VATTSTTVSATTTVPTTVSPTLPFTGQTAGLSGLALALGASGLLLLTGARRPERP
jgi:hypothetical protein